MRQTRHDRYDKVDIDKAATVLGISPGAVRKRIERRQLHARKVAGRWDVELDGDTTASTDDATTRQDTTRQHDGAVVFDSAVVEALQAEVTWLRAELERRGVELAEMRRLLGNEQQVALGAQAQAAVLTAPDVPLEAPENHESAPVDVQPVQTPAALEKTLKQAGVKGKKVRRRVAEAFAVLFGR
jgi:hypothetical protein